MQCGATTQKGTKCKIPITAKPCRYHGNLPEVNPDPPPNPPVNPDPPPNPPVNPEPPPNPPVNPEPPPNPPVIKTARDLQKVNISEVRKNWKDCPDFWSNYERAKYLGKGGFAEVLLVKAKDKQFALKILATNSNSYIWDDSVVLERLDHPGVVKSYEKMLVPYPPGTEGKVPALLMQYIDGVDLIHACTLKKMPPKVVRVWLKGSLETLKYIHSQNIVHRDIKPQNLIVDIDGKIVFLDFGISHISEDRESIIKTDNLTPLYAAPELFRPNYTRRNFEFFTKADIFSLGVTFYYVLTHKKPDWVTPKPKRRFNHEVFNKTMAKFQTPSEDASSDVYTTIKDMMAVMPKDRPSIDDLIGRLG